MSRTRASSPSRRSAVLGLFAAAVLAAAAVAPAAAQPLQLALVPAAPMWLDTVRLVATGDRVTSCLGFHLSPPAVTREAGNRYLIDVALLAECPPISGATEQHIDVSVELGRLDRGSYRVRLSDPNDLLPHELPFAVLDPGIEKIELPALSTDLEPGTLRVTTLAPAASGPPRLDFSVHDGVVEVHVVLDLFPNPFPRPFFPLESKTLEAPLPRLAAGDYELRVLGMAASFDEGLVRGRLRVWRAAGCLPAPDVLCLLDGRFRVTGTWKSFDGTTGVVHARPVPEGDRSGLLWFFAPVNAEISIKAIDGCTVNGHRWVFVASASSVEYDLAVTDTLTGRTVHYANSLGAQPPLRADIEAFPCD